MLVQKKPPIKYRIAEIDSMLDKFNMQQADAFAKSSHYELEKRLGLFSAASRKSTARSQQQQRGRPFDNTDVGEGDLMLSQRVARIGLGAKASATLLDHGLQSHHVHHQKKMLRASTSSSSTSRSGKMTVAAADANLSGMVSADYAQAKMAIRESILGYGKASVLMLTSGGEGRPVSPMQLRYRANMASSIAAQTQSRLDDSNRKKLEEAIMTNSLLANRAMPRGGGLRLREGAAAPEPTDVYSPPPPSNVRFVDDERQDQDISLSDPQPPTGGSRPSSRGNNVNVKMREARITTSHV